LTRPGASAILRACGAVARWPRAHTSTTGNPELKNHIFGKSPQYIKQSHRRRLSKPRFARLYQRVMADVAKSEKDYDA
jgi:hypothetical protein